jgi:hypothetical protein
MPKTGVFEYEVLGSVLAELSAMESSGCGVACSVVSVIGVPCAWALDVEAICPAESSTAFPSGFAFVVREAVDLLVVLVEAGLVLCFACSFASLWALVVKLILIFLIPEVKLSISADEVLGALVAVPDAVVDCCGRIGTVLFVAEPLASDGGDFLRALGALIGSARG